MASHVLLLRAPSDGKPQESAASKQEDPYVSLLAPATSVPVYETMHTVEELQWILETGPAFHGYNGVIVTSKRAVEAWAAAARKVPPPGDERAHWADIPFYTVGGATASAVRNLFPSLSSANAAHLAPRLVLGEETGTGEQLANFILTHLAAKRDAASAYSTASALGSATGSHSSTSLPLTCSVSTDNLSIFTRGDVQGHPLQDRNLELGAIEGSVSGNGNGGGEQRKRTKRSRTLRRPTKLLFLVGDKTRDVLPTILSSDENIELDSVQVYATEPSPNFPNALRSAVQAQPRVRDWWIAIFAPSGADYAIPYLREHFVLSPSFTSSPISPTSPAYPSSPSTPSSISHLAPKVSTSNSKSKKKDKKKGKDKGGSREGGNTVLPTARIAAIGPTTEMHLREVCKLEVVAVAAKPNAEALAAAIKGASFVK